MLAGNVILRIHTGYTSTCQLRHAILVVSPVLVTALGYQPVFIEWFNTTFL